MVDFVKMLAANEIIKQLDERSVPGEGLTWDRVLTFAKLYNKESVIEIDVTKLNEVSTDTLSDDQLKAWEKIQVWVKTDDPYFVLRGYAGSGKTYLLRLLKQLKIDNLFTAPTNKAAKVLSKSTNGKAVTTFSALGIKMSQEEDGLVLKFSDTPPYIPKKSILIVDECSMVGEQLCDFIDTTQQRTKCKILYVGDPAQLPPVGEARSKSWRATRDVDCRAFLKQIMRYDNELLNLATKIRECIQEKTYNVRIRDANDGKEGVFLHRSIAPIILKHKNPVDWQNRKVIAWRNKTVTEYNKLIRENFGFTDDYNAGDIILMAEPVELNGNIIASVDEEFTVKDIHEDHRKVYHESNEYEIPVWRLAVSGDRDLTLYVAKTYSDVERLLSAKAHKAKTSSTKSERRDNWRDFWETKGLFHKIRYGYALTAHRAQGSTYEEVFVDQRDILANENKREALRCLYVAATRATTNIHSF